MPHVWADYLVLGLRSRSPGLAEVVGDYIPFIDTADACLSWVPVENDPLLRDVMLAMRFRDPTPLHRAMQMAHQLETVDVLQNMCSQVLMELSLLPLDNLTRTKPPPWTEREICEVCGRDWYLLNDFPLPVCLGSCTLKPRNWPGDLKSVLKASLEHPEFERACSYLHESVVRLGWDVCDWREEQYNREFYRYVPIARAEAAFLNAFKAIEAVVGEPSKDRTQKRLRARMEALGVDPDSPFVEGSTLVEKVLHYHSLRDEVAAHGVGRLKRPLMLSEIIELQLLARFLIVEGSPKPEDD